MSCCKAVTPFGRQAIQGYVSLRLAAGVLLAFAVAAGVHATGSPLPSASPCAAGPIDGPSAGIVTLDGLSVARDGTGGLVYLETSAALRTCSSRARRRASSRRPVQVDAGLRRRLLAAGDRGRATAGSCWSRSSTAATCTWSTGRAPAAGRRAAAAGGGGEQPVDPDEHLGKAYLAFTAPTAAATTSDRLLRNGSGRSSPAAQRRGCRRRRRHRHGGRAGRGGRRRRRRRSSRGARPATSTPGGCGAPRRASSPSRPTSPRVSGCSEVSAGESRGRGRRRLLLRRRRLPARSLRVRASQQSRVLLTRLHGSSTTAPSAARRAVEPGRRRAPSDRPSR